MIIVRDRCRHGLVSQTPRPKHWAPLASDDDKRSYLPTYCALTLAYWFCALFTMVIPASAEPSEMIRNVRQNVALSPYRAIIEREAKQAGLSPDIADAVMAVESRYDPHVVGASGEIGLMQVMPATARFLGFSGSLAELAIPEINAHYGIVYLAQAWRLAGGDLCTTVMKYRAGHGETRFSNRSVDYCIAVRARLIEHGIPVTGRVPVATFGERTRSGRKMILIGSSGAGPDLETLNKQLSELVWQTKAHVDGGP